MEHLNGSVASITVGGRTYARRSVPRCLVCSSPEREQVERALLRGDPPSLIAESIPNAGLTARNVADHWRSQHLPIDDEVRALLQDEAEERGRPVGDAARTKAAHIRLAEAVVERVTAALETGEIEPNVRDAVAAAGLLARYGPAEDNDGPNTMYALVKVLSTVRKHASPDQVARIAADLRANGVARLLGIEGSGQP